MSRPAIPTNRPRDDSFTGSEFEVGASWSRTGRIYPLCTPEIDLSELPEPLNRLQALSLGKAEHVKLFFDTLCRQFEFGNMKGFRGSDITKRLPKYSTQKVQEVDLQSGTLYHGPYVGYSDDELTEIIDEQFLRHPFLHFAEMNRIKLPMEWRAPICNGALIHFRGVDQELKLPPGTAARLSSTPLSATS